MKTIALLLLMLPLGFACLAQTPRPVGAKPKIKIIHNDKLLTLAANELEVPRLRRLYNKSLRVSKISRNIYESAVRDTILISKAGGDELAIFVNKFNTFLLSANITSQKLAFGHGIRIGVSKAIFCKAFNLPVAFDNYRIVAEDSDTNIYFAFRQSTLVSVTFQAGGVE